MSLTPPFGTCQSELTFVPIDDFPEVPGTTLQFFIAGSPITGVMNIGGATNGSDIQAVIDADATYITSGATITVTANFGHLEWDLIALIQVNSSVQIITQASGRYFSPTVPYTNFQQASFVCNLPAPPNPFIESTKPDIFYCAITGKPT